ncbi:PepSY-like domain-containing protein [Flavobacterium sp. MFBS3-15]|uniref:PepSY-like domain-containing protein n=1 Tax=Flavobacterium sp. MFBS3-15 TaxID=2989816 RepID=UPI00223558F6|nr:PepSY-like domain-containing protein [Flavobacterium sp. MFBS3-15]MCW4467507.1 PepSY-like domain-containing protein [Flavobacterium sp. MFBS3-15]
MKKMFFIALAAISLMGAACNDDDNNGTDTIIQATDLPQAARSFVETHFPGATYTRVEKQSRADSDGSIYDVQLSNGFEIDFTAQGAWTDIDGNHQAIPAAIVPASISQYVTANYASQSVTNIGIERHGYDVELSNDVELVFNTNGQFIRIDR